MQKHTKVKDNFKKDMRLYLMFVTAVCVLFLIRTFHSERLEVITKLLQ